MRSSISKLFDVVASQIDIVVKGKGRITTILKDSGLSKYYSLGT